MRVLGFGVPQPNLQSIVEILASGKAFEVEFSDREGRTYESVGLRPNQLMVLCFDRVSPTMVAA